MYSKTIVQKLGVPKGQKVKMRCTILAFGLAPRPPGQGGRGILSTINILTQMLDYIFELFRLQLSGFGTDG